MTNVKAKTLNTEVRIILFIILEFRSINYQVKLQPYRLRLRLVSLRIIIKSRGLRSNYQPVKLKLEG